MLMFRDTVAELVARTDAVLAHLPLYTPFASRIAALPQLAHHAWAAISAFDLGVNGRISDKLWPAVRRLRSAMPPRFHAR